MLVELFSRPSVTFQPLPLTFIRDAKTTPELAEFVVFYSAILESGWSSGPDVDRIKIEEAKERLLQTIN
jgi:hypothetical protein